MRDRGSPSEVVLSELYVSLQGEGTRAGRRCAFVRLTGCGLRCRWCDTAYAFEGGERRPVAEVVAEVLSLGVPLVLITGGEPLEQPGCFALAEALCDAGFELLVETGGHVPTRALDPRAVRILDVKCPGSGMQRRNHLPNLGDLRPCDEVKFVVADREDFDYARARIEEYRLDALGCPLLFSPAHGELEPARLAAWLQELPFPQARLNLQLHKILWPERARGV
ncbi:MAG: radical SAM protein [Planctomycetota bacterium]|nr:MAG: radical SAM protein [Planctomycetota bacterium]